jgi:hypothetical protein
LLHHKVWRAVPSCPVWIVQHSSIMQKLQSDQSLQGGFLNSIFSTRHLSTVLFLFSLLLNQPFLLLPPRLEPFLLPVDFLLRPPYIHNDW